MELDADVIVVGIGTMGSQALWQLAARGLKALGIEQFEPGHERGSGHGGSRIFRTAYMEGQEYVPLLKSAYGLWRRLERESGADLLTLTGALSIGAPDTRFIAGALASVRAHDLDHELLSTRQLRERYPLHVVADDEVGLLDVVAGVLRPEDAIKAAARRAEELGATIVRNAPVDSITPGDTVAVRAGGRTYRARHLVVSAGAWLGRVQPDLGLAFPLIVYRVVMTWFRPDSPASFAPNRFPIFLRERGTLEWDGFPCMDGETVKVLATTKIPVDDPSQLDRDIRREDLEKPEYVVREFLRGVDPTAIRAQACMLTFTPDEHFIVGPSPRHGNVVVLGGFSGHGYKFAPLMGEIAADLVTEGRTSHPIELFRPARFAAHEAQSVAEPA